MVAVTDKQVATLKAQLAGDADEHERLLAELDPARDSAGYEALMAAAFITASERRFGLEPRRSEIIKFVGDLRGRSATIAEELTPAVAEHMIMTALGHGSVDGVGIEGTTRVRAQVFITVGLVGDEYLEEPGLDAFMEEARELAERLTGAQGG